MLVSRISTSHGLCRTLRLSTWCHGRFCIGTTIWPSIPKYAFFASVVAILPKSMEVLQCPMRLHYSENEETVRKLAKLGKAAWRNPACTGRRVQNVKGGADLRWDVAKQANFRTSPDFTRYCECQRVDINAPDEKATICRTIRQDVEFIKVVYQEAEAQVVTSKSPEAIVSTGAGLFLCETSDNTPPSAKRVLHEFVTSSWQLIFADSLCGQSPLVP